MISKNQKLSLLNVAAIFLAISCGGEGSGKTGLVGFTDPPQMPGENPSDTLPIPIILPSANGNLEDYY
ncbi:MAG: hypothetical protein Q7S00_02430, partial [bacterium]|nr:hypothetical protein [bacterium]